MKQNEFTSLQISIASPDIVRSWSRGEVVKPETINYRTGRSERGGLFDERIFGPEKDYQCYCGKYKGIRYKGIVCEKCNVEVTRAVVRRERMGHIDLASPVAHIWMLRGIPSRMSLLLGVPVTQLEKVIYFAGYIVTSVDDDARKKILKELETEYKTKLKTLESEEDQEKLSNLYSQTKNEITALKVHKVLTELEYHTFSMKYSTLFEAGIGAEAIFDIFKNLDLPALEKELENARVEATKAQREKIQKRLVLIRSLIRSHTNPEWMFLQVIPIIPPALRPMVALEGGRHATSDINDLYRRVINRNNRLKKLQEIGAPDVILRNEKRILQEAVDSLIDNSIRKHSGSAAMSKAQTRKLKSLADNLKGKEGLFRKSLLGKRVDYSGRSVIVVGPRLHLNQCGLPKHMALELFRPFVMAEIIKRELAFNIRGANRMIEEADDEVWEILEHVIKGKYVLLNRAPTLHRLSIQAFNPVLIEGRAIQVHPLVCSAFNADFDGDQMAVHLPLSEPAQREARELIAANKNLLKPQTGDPIVAPSQDIVLGAYWMTTMVDGAKGEGRVFGSVNEAIMFYDYEIIDFRARIKVRGSDTLKYAKYEGGFFETSVGLLIFNSIFPDDFAFINKAIGKKQLNRIISEVIDRYGVDEAPAMLDKIKHFGNKYVTMSGITHGMDEARVPAGKNEKMAEGEAKVAKINEQYDGGLISDEERYRMTIETWEEVKHEIMELLKGELTENAAMDMMMTSGARGNMNSYSQVAGMKGIIVNAKGHMLDFPIRSCYKEGFTPLEYFINTTTARKGLTDTALNTAKAGYLTRRLHDVAQEVVISEDDCGTTKGLVMRAQVIDGLEKSLSDMIIGRVAGDTVKDPKGNNVFNRNTLITKEVAAAIEAAGVEEVTVRSPLTCEAGHGLCSQCYGLDLGRNHLVKLGEAVGTVASQAIGEPGTQLTLRTFHSGGVTGRDITQGLPRVEELFERRTPKVPAVIAEADGMISNIVTEDGIKTLHLTKDAAGKSNKGSQTVTYQIDARRIPIVKKGENVVAGQALTDGSCDPQAIFQVAGKEAAENYLIEEISKVYELHGTGVDRKHLELIVRQMFSRCEITDPGDSLFTTGETVEVVRLNRVNEELEAEGKLPAKADVILQGISNVSLSTTSWLSAASFQHTNRVLIAAAIEGRNDVLRGLKENVIIGDLIPAGTGLTDDFIDMTDLYPEEEEEEIVETFEA
ncbi:DNA-directed RNA polymerase subunit beta' [Candidatus Nomurabacteria bacterium]|nr:DNA-directed RNA polymerase subunit beta' [Candidatus Nomurabacteria bacterium]